MYKFVPDKSLITREVKKLRESGKNAFKLSVPDIRLIGAGVITTEVLYKKLPVPVPDKRFFKRDLNRLKGYVRNTTVLSKEVPVPVPVPDVKGLEGSDKNARQAIR